MFVYMRSQTDESSLQHFRLNLFASYSLSYIKRIIIGLTYSFKIASLFTRSLLPYIVLSTVLLKDEEKDIQSILIVHTIYIIYFLTVISICMCRVIEPFHLIYDYNSWQFTIDSMLAAKC